MSALTLKVYGGKKNKKIQNERLKEFLLLIEFVPIYLVRYYGNDDQLNIPSNSYL